MQPILEYQRLLLNGCKFVKTSKRFRSYGTADHLPIRGKAQVTLTAKKGAHIDTYVYIVDDKRGQSLLGESDAIRLGIVTFNPEGANKEVNISTSSSTEDVHKIRFENKHLLNKNGPISGNPRRN